MKVDFKCVSTGLLATLALSSAVIAGPLEDGNAAYKRHDYKTAMRILRPLAINGDKLAQVTVGLMYKLGYGVQLDWVAAFQWFNAAAKDGDKLGSFELNEISPKMTAREMTRALDVSHQWTPSADTLNTQVDPETWNCGKYYGEKIFNQEWNLANGRMFAPRGKGFFNITLYNDQLIVATHAQRWTKSSNELITVYIVIERQTGNYLEIDNIVMTAMSKGSDSFAEPSLTTGHCDLKG